MIISNNVKLCKSYHYEKYLHLSIFAVFCRKFKLCTIMTETGLFTFERLLGKNICCKRIPTTISHLHKQVKTLFIFSLFRE